jgi:hypothetical protein
VEEKCKRRAAEDAEEDAETTEKKTRRITSPRECMSCISFLLLGGWLGWLGACIAFRNDAEWNRR